MKMWHHRVAQALGCVGKWVEQGHDLEPLEHTERSPRILNASSEQERCQDEREHQANLLWSHERSNGQAEAAPANADKIITTTITPIASART